MQSQARALPAGPTEEGRLALPPAPTRTSAGPKCGSHFRAAVLADAPLARARDSGTPDAVRTAERADGAGNPTARRSWSSAWISRTETLRAPSSFRRVLPHDPSHIGATCDPALVADRDAAEAGHDAGALVPIAPDDPRLPALRATLGSESGL